MAQPWIARLLDHHTTEHDGVERLHLQIRHLETLLEMLVDVLENVGIAQRAVLERNFEYHLATHNVAVGRVPTPSSSIGYPAHQHASSARHGHSDTVQIHQQRPPSAPMQPMQMPAPTPHVTPHVAETTSPPPAWRAPAQQLRTPVAATPAIAPAASPFISCAICKKNVLRATTNAIAGVGEVCDSCVGAG